MKTLLCSLVLTTTMLSAHTVPENRLSEKWWQTRWEAAQQRIAEKSYDVVFIGDSIIQGFENAGKTMWAEHYAPLNALNLGFSGDRTEHVIWRLQQTDFSKLKPKVAVIMIGTNNTGHKMQAPAEVAAGIAEIVTIVSEKSPDTHVLLLGVFPRDEMPNGKKRQNNYQINERIKDISAPDQITYLDIASAFLDDDGVLAKDIMPDGLHLSPKGYALWAEAMNPTLMQILEE